MRYIGNKQKLLDNIKKLLEDKDIFKENYTFFDAFSWTASVWNFFKNRFKIIANDSLYFSYVIAYAKLNPIDKKFKNLKNNPFDYFNKDKIWDKWFFYNNYSLWWSDRMYFSEDNAKKIDFIRIKIEDWYKKQKIDKFEYYYLIACLLESISKVSNVAWVYGSFLKTWDSRAVKPMKFIDIECIENNNIFENEIHNELIENIICDFKWDILYLDPPYTKNQYSTQYHILETLALYDNPEIFWKTWHREVISKNSKFSKSWWVHIEFEKIIRKSKFKYIIMSYNSCWIMSKEFIERTLKRYWKEETFELREIDYRQYLNSKTEKKDIHHEYLFFIEKKDDLSEINYKSPLNYVWWKFDMVDFIKSNSPKNINRVIDLFWWGFNVWINFNVEQIIYNDLNFKVKEILEMFKNEDTTDLYKYLCRMIKKYKLEKNYKEWFVKIRDLYNSKKVEKRDSRLLYLLILYWFNQQIRFNSNLDYNNPVGQSSFNDKILENFISYINVLKTKNITFHSKDYEDLIDYMNEETFVYVDPPYLITCASYNDWKRWFNGWNEKEELRLLDFLDKLNKKNIKFMLSNILEKWESKNLLLKRWIKKNNFKVIKYDWIVKKWRNEILVINY